jgi:glycosyltransferase involved in cell wall biosynthesis
MKLSVFILTYNHERFIEQAVRSVLMQKTGFPFELVIGEDASTDATAHLVRRLQAEHPDKVRATIRTHNVGMHRNFIETYRACAGEYVAFLDGDDYWTSPDKLQKQVDFLDAHPACSLCFHNVQVRLEERDEIEGLGFDNPGGQSTFEIDDLIVNNFIPSCSVVARNRLIDHFPDWLPEVALVDWVYTLLLARHGSISYLDEPMAVYRKHAGGVWSAHDGAIRHERILAVYDRMPSILDRRHRTLARTAAERFRLWTGNEWLRGQVVNCQAEVERLNRSIDWLRGQVASSEAELKNTVQAYNDCRAWIVELEKAKEWLLRQLDERRAAVQALDEALAEIGRLRGTEDENARLRSYLQGIESSRGWKLLQRARRLVHVLGRKPLGRARQLVASWRRDAEVPAGGVR